MILLDKCQKSFEDINILIKIKLVWLKKTCFFGKSFYLKKCIEKKMLLKKFLKLFKKNCYLKQKKFFFGKNTFLENKFILKKF